VFTRSTIACVAPLLVDGAAFAVGHRVAVKSGRDELVFGRVRQQVAGNLLDRELIERLVGVERADHIIAKGPDGPRRIVSVTGGIRITRQVQPHARPMFAKCLAMRAKRSTSRS
jgi:hypothetical protein